MKRIPQTRHKGDRRDKVSDERFHSRPADEFEFEFEAKTEF